MKNHIKKGKICAAAIFIVAALCFTGCHARSPEPAVMEETRDIQENTQGQEPLSEEDAEQYGSW